MKVALLYPPPWKIPLPGQPADRFGNGPPEGFRPTDLDADFFQMPIGVLSLAAQSLRAGHRVKVLNLSAFPWENVQDVVRRLDADIYGLSCFTANRRGVRLLAQSLRARHPSTPIVVGGPHASALAAELLEREPAIDVVVIGEGEPTWAALLAQVEAGKSLSHLEGTAFRQERRVVVAHPRDRIRDLDTLASPHDYFDTHVVMTSRGCPWQCTFCASRSVWGPAVRTHSVDYVLAMLEQAASRLPVRMITIKDDTFTANRKRALAICRGMRERGLQLAWSCDTRADTLDDELLREMRLAGCERLSLGVESGSRAVLRAIRKRLDVDAVLEATKLAKQVGLRVRFYMMLGNRREDAHAFRESLELVDRAQPHEALFSCLSVYPGTQDFGDLVRMGRIDREAYFEQDFQELKMPFDASEADTQLMDTWFRENSGLRRIHSSTAEELRQIATQLGEHGPALLDLAVQELREGNLESAQQHAQRALAAHHPTPGRVLSALATVAVARGDLRRAVEQVEQAARVDPQHWVVWHNTRAVQRWRDLGEPRTGPQLRAESEFVLWERTTQPMLPGPLAGDALEW